MLFIQTGCSSVMLRLCNLKYLFRSKTLTYRRNILFLIEMIAMNYRGTADIGKGFIPQKFSGFVSLFKPEKLNKFEQRFWQ